MDKTIMKKILAALFFLYFASIANGAGSSINPSIPFFGAPLSSDPIRSNFAAAYSDVNNLIGQNWGTSAPSTPQLGQVWLNTNAVPYVLSEWDGTNWVVIGDLNASTHLWSPPVSSGGTGATSLTAHSVLVGEGTAAINPISAATSGYLLSSNGSGADPSFVPFTQLGTGATGRVWAAKAGDLINGKDFGVAQDGTTDDTTNLQKALTYAGTLVGTNGTTGAQFGGAVVYINASATQMVIAGNLTVPDNVCIIGIGNYPGLLWTGTTGSMFTFAGSSGFHNGYACMENLELDSLTRHAGTAVTVQYIDVSTFKNIRTRRFQYGFQLSDANGAQFIKYDPLDNKYGIEIGENCGGFTSRGSTWDSNETDVLIDGIGHGFVFSGDIFDTDASGLNGVNAKGAFSVTAAATNITLDTIQVFEEAVPGNGASVVFSGGSNGIEIRNSWFTTAVSGAAAAIKFDSTSNVFLTNPTTSGYTTSSYVQTSSAHKVTQVLGNNSESTTVTGTGAANFNDLLNRDNGFDFGNMIFAEAGITLKGDSSLTWNSSDNSSAISSTYSSGDVYLTGILSGHGLSFSGTRYAIYAGTPNGNITGSVGDVVTDTAGGAGSTLWVKESGSATNTGWIATNALATSSTNGIAHFGTGLTVSSGLVTPTFGTAANQVVQGGVITAGGPTGSATVAPIVTYNAAGQLTAVSSATITPDVGSVTGLGTGVATALGVNTGSSGAVVLQNGPITTSTLNGGLPFYTLTVTGVNFNATGDTVIPVTLPVGYTTYQVSATFVAGTSGTFGTAKGGLYTAASQGGVNIIPQAIPAITSTSPNTIGNAVQEAAAAGASTATFNVANLYYNVGTVQGAAAVGNVSVSIRPLY